ncbi:TrmO family methyltransferase domain-containing protein [Aliamphritea spongicola]|uniref:TrmO family methyltransferase domain-containing protein n=1 Tax=Aliamphritea spongicola TaxID=707589 RepID=UPI00196B0293|nr:TrmO family methyltransferase [Aliamphritea spongicola]MBN3561018.1 SAM-dependent methyltransferase [Aliamphritea spongicola]
MNRQLTFIGHISTPYNTLDACPNNISFEGPACQLKLKPEYRRELSGLNEGQNILILYWLQNPDESVNQPYRYTGTGGCDDTDSKRSGTFALRTPLRPNPVGAAVLPIQQISDGEITVRGLDCLNNTRLLDIKPAIYLEAGKAS